METIRCPRCQKLLRADAQSCRRCGMIIPKSKAPRKRAVNDIDISQPTSPLASPHRAGHYSGLHPEDQPFQSSFFVRVQRAPEPEPLFETDASAVLDLERPLPTPPDYEEPSPLMGYDEDEGPDLPDYEEPSPIVTYEEDEDASALKRLADLPTLYPRRAPETPFPETPLPVLPRRSRVPRIARIMIAGSLICFLMASGLLAFLLLNKHQNAPQAAPQPRLIALPGELRVGDMLQLTGSGFDAHHVVSLTRDSKLALLDARGQQLLPTTDAQGTFQIHVPVTPAWSLGVHRLQASEGRTQTSTLLTIQAAAQGLPRLQLGASPISLGSGNPGTSSSKKITLTNTGGGRVPWSAQSDVDWLSLNPSSGSFAGSMLVVLTVNRANLIPQAYVGHIVFTQDQRSAQTLTVTMAVNTRAANLVLYTASLSFGGTPAQSPAGQTMVIQNNGGQPLNWSAASSTTGGGAWLSVTPASGLLDANTSAILTVNVATLQMAPGTFQGVLNFSYADGPVQQVTVTLNVTPPPQPAMQLSQQSLSFTTRQGVNPPPQRITIANPGNAPLNWAIQADTNGQTYLAISPAKGSVPPGQSENVSITPLLGSANGSIKSTLTVVDSDTGTTVPKEQIAVSIAITNEPVITLVTSTIAFDHTSDNSSTDAPLIFTNSGSLPLNWTLVESAQVPWLAFDETSGPLAAGHSTSIDVRCDSSQMQPGTYTVTLTLQNSVAGSGVAPQSVIVTLVISA
ncbi:MAG TPA: choice-of-anchor D domain-containing protein [Ktedonobacteraceae bacterium]